MARRDYRKSRPPNGQSVHASVQLQAAMKWVRGNDFHHVPTNLLTSTVTLLKSFGAGVMMLKWQGMYDLMQSHCMWVRKHTEVPSLLYGVLRFLHSAPGLNLCWSWTCAAKQNRWSSRWRGHQKDRRKWSLCRNLSSGKETHWEGLMREQAMSWEVTSPSGRRKSPPSCTQPSCIFTLGTFAMVVRSVLPVMRCEGNFCEFCELSICSCRCDGKVLLPHFHRSFCAHR